MSRTFEFLEQCERLMKPYVQESLKNHREKKTLWVQQNQEKFKEMQRKYFESDKGRYAISKRSARRRKFFNAACEGLDGDERDCIGRFYKNCPEGHEVDHIIPISKGGKHILSNLQYLTISENRRKSNKIVEICS